MGSYTPAPGFIGGAWDWVVGVSGNLNLENAGAVTQTIKPSGRFSAYGGTATVSGGIPSDRGIDDRTAITSTDASPITVYAVPTQTGKFRITVTVVGRGGTVSSAVYTYKYTVNTTTITKTISISSVDTDAENSLIVQPDASTNITAQLTTLTGSSASVDLTCLVEAIGATT